MIQVLIPAAGKGSRFSGYSLPKPLIDVNGSPMIVRAIKSLDIKNANFLFVVPKNNYTNEIKNSILSLNINSTFIEIDYVTQGAACTSLLFKEYINNNDELIITNCDQIMEWDASKFLTIASHHDGCVVTYHANTEKNSYAKIDKKGSVTEIREKEVISNVSLNGIHYWKKGKYFVESAEEMINNNDRSINGEFYIGPTYNYMIKKSLTVGIYHIPNQQHHPVGTPEDLETFLKYERNL